MAKYILTTPLVNDASICLMVIWAGWYQTQLNQTFAWL